MTTTPDIFSNVHKGIRTALFAACSALGRADEDGPQLTAARALTRDVLRFIAHHGENEDLILLPDLRERAPEVFARIERAHAVIGSALEALRDSIDSAPAHELYHRACVFTAAYLQHMHEEELELQPAIRAAFSTDELASFGRRSVERTSPSDQRMMLGWMLPAMTQHDADAFLARLPSSLASELRALRTT